MTARQVADPGDYRSLDYRPPERVRWGLPAALVPLAFFALLPLLLPALSAIGLSPSGWGRLVIGVGAYLLPAAWAVVVARRRGLGSLRRDFGLAFRPVDLAIGLAAAIGVELIRLLIGVVLVSVTPERPTPNVQVSDSVAGNVALAVIAIGIAPVVEELLMRGMLLRALRNALLRRRPEPSEARRHWATDASVLLSAAVFTALHLHEAPDLVTAVTLTLAVFPMGLVVGWLATRTGRLGPGIVTHALVNGLALALALTLR
ncbi:MAG: protease family protein [Microbacteriaceae bacterium]|nr:protease family protein [Microbacteriaceae bacterium]